MRCELVYSLSCYSEFEKRNLCLVYFLHFTLTLSFTLSIGIIAGHLSHWWDPKGWWHKLVHEEGHGFWIKIDGGISRGNVYDKTTMSWFIHYMYWNLIMQVFISGLDEDCWSSIEAGWSHPSGDDKVEILKPKDQWREFQVAIKMPRLHFIMWLMQATSSLFLNAH